MLSCIGPNEAGGTQHTAHTTQSSCGGTPTIPPVDAPISEAPYQGQIVDKLSSPLAETTSGTQTMLFTISAWLPHPDSADYRRWTEGPLKPGTLADYQPSRGRQPKQPAEGACHHQLEYAIR